MAIFLFPGQKEVDVVRALDRIDQGELRAYVRRGKGSCVKIGNIFDVYLHPWFSNIADFKPDETRALELLFEELRNADGWVYKLADGLVENAEKLAPEMRAGLVNKDLGAAQQKVAEFNVAVHPTLKKIGESVARLNELQNQFIDIWND